MNVNKVVIIGAGPAGISTAIQLKRYNIDPVIIEQDEIGGLLRNANLVENYPGFPEGINGISLVRLFAEQLRNFNVKVCLEKVLEIEFRKDLFHIKTDSRELKSEIAVIASGTKPRKISFKVDSEEIKNRIFYEVYPLLGQKNCKIVIIGAGDAAFDYALNLSFANTIVILNRGGKLSCLPILFERCRKSDKIEYFENIQVTSIIQKENKLLLNCTHKNMQDFSPVVADYLIAAIGREPRLNFLGSELERRLDYLKKLKKLYIIGDVKNEIYRQTAISAGDGVRAAMEIYRSFGVKRNENTGENRE